VSELHVGVNFDPANMLLYGSGEPIEAMKLLLPFVKQAHIKDARRASQPGIWGEEVPVGTGEVDWPTFLKVLANGGFSGNLIIEREAGDARVADCIQAKRFLQSVF
jgi:sugar phosphate isomerase/epimerase